jgi:hypothetical protein
MKSLRRMKNVERVLGYSLATLWITGWGVAVTLLVGLARP